MNAFKITILILLIGCSGIGFSQGNSSCSGATPFCTGQTMNFPAGVNSGVAQSGPAYGCLGSEPNPAWFFMQMANSGSMSIAMSAASDIDFICWGPFPSLTGACSNLIASNIQSCSYSASNTETCTISSAVAGQFYLMLITNYSNQSQNITFNQSNTGSAGAAATNCGFVCVITASATPLICSGQNATVSISAGTSTAVTSYTWSGPNGFSSNAFSNAIPSVQSSGIYNVIGTSSAVLNGVPYTGTCQAAVTLSVVQYPSYSVSPTTTNICQGGNFFAGVTFTPAANPLNYIYHWYPASGGGVWQPFANTTLISPPLSPPNVSLTTLVYTVTVEPNTPLVSCPVTKTLAVTINNPLTPTINPIPPLCNTSNTVQLTATPGGGTWSANPAVNTSGLFTPAFATVVGTSSVSYAVSVGTCIVNNTQTVSVSRYYSPALTTSISTLCVQDPAFNLMNIVQNTLTGVWSGTQVTSNFFNPSGLASGNYNLTYSTTSLPNPTACPASTVLVVPVFNPPAPVIAAIPPLCNSAGTVQLNATPVGGIWSGASGVSPAGVQTPSSNVIGTNTLVYTAGLGTCVASSSRTFHVSQFNTALLTGTVPPLCVSNNPVNLMSIVQNTNGSWSGMGTYNGNSFNPANLATSVYTLTYKTVSVPNATLCPDSSHIAISVLNPATPNISQAGPFCSADGTVQLVVTPAVGHWVASSFLSASGVFSPGVSPIGNNPVQYVIGTNTCNAQQTKIISTEAFVSAAITSSLADQCTTGPQVNLDQITLNNLGNWSGQGMVGSYFDPSLSGAGKFTLTYNTASIPSGLCPDKSIVSVNVFSLAIPSIKGVGPFCNKSLPLQLQVSPIGGLFGSGIAGAVSEAGLFNPAMAMIGDNIISYSISSGPCIANALTHISVEKFVSADFANYGENVYCVNSQPFNLNGLVQNPGGLFTGSGVNESMFNPATANLGINTVTYQTHSTPSALLCPDTKTININVRDIPHVTASSTRYKGCAPLEVSLVSPAGINGLGSWNTGDGSDPEPTLSANHIFTSPGTYTVVFNYRDSDAKGCSTQVMLDPIVVYETPKADFSVSPDDITIANPEVTLTNLSTTLKNNRYNWTIEGLNQVYEVNPTVYFPTIGKYKVTLTATTIEGCKDEITRIVEVKNDFSAYIPNTFTPNYDGLNDTFKPVFSLYGLDPTTYSLEIFDRWGTLLFSTTDHAKGWDGTIQNKGDEPLKQDVYVFKLKYKDLNGQVYNKIGDVTLLK